MSDISVFGLKTRAERVLFVIDASKTMLTDQKGGLNSYRVIKDEISTMVGNLSTGTLFNVVFFDNGRFLFFKPRPVPAGSEVTSELIQWIVPINSDVKNLGLRGAKPMPLKTKIEGEDMLYDAIPQRQYSSGNENAYLTQVFLEQSIDAIFIITGRHNGFERVRRSMTPRESEEWQRNIARPDYQRDLKLYQEERARLVPEARKKKAEQDAARKKRGLPPQIFDGGSLVRQMGLEYRTRHPGGAPGYYIEKRDVESYFRKLVKKLYADQGGANPSINIILFLAGDETFSEDKEDELKDYTRFFDGKYRVIRGLEEIKSASSAKETKN
jgi:hypothetical protein